ncbi:MAG TPA: CGNR zinc finger domain-containing protein [Candidatus Eremiobacteraceae bacterium]|jgi:predicted RNA-binding Zn ribbon-like protein
MKDRIGEKPAPARLRVVQGFLNTATSGREDFASPDCLREWLTDHDLLEPDAAVSADDLRQAIAVRQALVQLALARQEDRSDTGAAEVLNRAARSAQMSVSFGQRGRACIEPLAPAVDGALGKIIAIVVDAMADGTWERFKICRDPGCSWAFYDRSKNHSGTWCDITSCGNIAKARTYRARHATKATRGL